MRLPVAMLLALCCFSPLPALAATAVVVGADSVITDMGKGQLTDLYLGKPVLLKNGGLVQAVDIADPALRSLFYQQLTRQSLAMIDAYWAQLQFAGRSKPLPKLGSEQAVIDYVRRRANAIGYISPRALPRDQSVRVLMIME